MKPSNNPSKTRASVAKPTVDGRAQRTVRSRLAIIEAVFALYEQGNLVPTAQQVADQSGLGIRTVFRHFSEMEKLYVEGDRILHERYAKLPVLHPTGSLQSRIDQLTSERVTNCEMFAPYIRATLAQLWRYINN